MAKILKKTFREADILARLGGDEFTALVRDASSDTAEVIGRRLLENLGSHAAQRRHNYELSLSMGFVGFAPDGAATIKELIAEADRAMYEHKRSKRRTASELEIQTHVRGASKQQVHPLVQGARAVMRKSYQDENTDC